MDFGSTPGRPVNPGTLKVEGNSLVWGPNLLTTIAVWPLEISKQLNNRLATAIWPLEISKQLNNRLATDTWRSEARKNDN